jgi:hypothetical protein
MMEMKGEKKSKRSPTSLYLSSADDQSKGARGTHSAASSQDLEQPEKRLRSRQKASSIS